MPLVHGRTREHISNISMAVRLRVLKKCACELLSFGIDLVKTSNRNGDGRLFAFCCFAYSIQVSSRWCFSGSAKDENESIQVFSRGCFLGLPRVRMNGGIQMDFLCQFMLSPDPCPFRFSRIFLLSMHHSLVQRTQG